MEKVTTTGRATGAVLCREAILAEVEAGAIRVEPWDAEAVGCASIDLRLSNEFRFYHPGLSVLDVREETDFRDITERVVVPEGDSFLLLPGTACLGITVEKVSLAPHLCGLLGAELSLCLGP